MCADVVVGHVRQMWRRPKQMKVFANKLNPRMWIVLNSATINGHSGGPCVNMQGEVIGILSYSDENGRRCFVVPATEWKDLIRRAKLQMQSSTSRPRIRNNNTGRKRKDKGDHKI